MKCNTLLIPVFVVFPQLRNVDLVKITPPTGPLFSQNANNELNIWVGVGKGPYDSEVQGSDPSVLVSTAICNI